MESMTKLEQLQQLPCYLLDLFPKQVPPKPDHRYFEIEEYFWQDIQNIREKFCRVLLKLYCYHDFWVSAQGEQGENPRPEQLIRWVRRCFSPQKRGQVLLCLLDCEGLLKLEAGDLYLEVYTREEGLLQLLCCLARSEGLFFYRAAQ